jgi:hypothetical protein
MTATVQRVARFLALLLLMFALLRGMEVGQGLWQGSGLHGYIIHHGKANSGITVSVWAAFVQTLALAGVSGLFAGIFLWCKKKEPPMTNSADCSPRQAHDRKRTGRGG